MGDFAQGHAVAGRWSAPARLTRKDSRKDASFRKSRADPARRARRRTKQRRRDLGSPAHAGPCRILIAVAPLLLLVGLGPALGVPAAAQSVHLVPVHGPLEPGKDGGRRFTTRVDPARFADLPSLKRTFADEHAAATGAASSARTAYSSLDFDLVLEPSGDVLSEALLKEWRQGGGLVTAQDSGTKNGAMLPVGLAVRRQRGSVSQLFETMNNALSLGALLGAQTYDADGLDFQEAEMMSCWWQVQLFVNFGVCIKNWHVRWLQAFCTFFLAPGALLAVGWALVRKGSSGSGGGAAGRGASGGSHGIGDSSPRGAARRQSSASSALGTPGPPRRSPGDAHGRDSLVSDSSSPGSGKKVFTVMKSAARKIGGAIKSSPPSSSRKKFEDRKSRAKVGLLVVEFWREREDIVRRGRVVVKTRMIMENYAHADSELLCGINMKVSVARTCDCCIALCQSLLSGKTQEKTHDVHSKIVSIHLIVLPRKQLSGFPSSLLNGAVNGSFERHEAADGSYFWARKFSGAGAGDRPLEAGFLFLTQNHAVSGKWAVQSVVVTGESGGAGAGAGSSAEDVFSDAGAGGEVVAEAAVVEEDPRNVREWWCQGGTVAKKARVE